MSKRLLAVVLMTAVGTAGTAVGIAWAFAQHEKKAPEQLVPAGAVLYASFDGSEEHEAAWKETAAYDALHDSGLDELAEKFLAAMGEQAKAGGVPVDLDGVWSAIGLVSKKGATFAVTMDPAAGPIPTATIVLHEAAGLEPRIGGVVRAVAAEEGFEFEEKNVQGRKVVQTRLPEGPPVELAWWAESGHLVITVGLNAAAQGIAVATGDAPNITSDPLWKKYGGEGEFEVTSRVWLDFARVREVVSPIPLPPLRDGRVVTVKDVLEPLGLNGLDTFAVVSGYDGKSLRSDVTFDAPGPRTGLLALIDQKPMTMDDLPPIPANATGFSTFSMDWAKSYDTMVGIARNMTKFGPPEAAAQLEDALDQAPRMLGFDPRNDLLEPLGHVHCVYAEPNASFLGIPLGFGAAVSVDDADKLKNTLAMLVGRAKAMVDQEVGPNGLTIHRNDRFGSEIVTLEIGGGFVNPSFVVDGDWLVVGVTPQTVQSFLLRQSGKLDRWSAEDHAELFAGLPKEFTSFTYTDPRPAVQGLAAAAPTVLGFVQGAIAQSGEFGPNFRMPVSAADLPPAELVTRPLFPNVSVGWTTDEGTRVVTRSSLPAMPSMGSGAAATPVLVALLLPAVQQAREAARKAQSKNNMKQLGLAMHNYHDTFGHMPVGTVPNAKLKPEARLSWMYSVLPFIEQGNLFEQIDEKEGWKGENNGRWTDTTISVFVNPNVATDDAAGKTHYVGIAGYGKDPWALPAGHARAGLFGDDRKVRFRDITDGLSNTMAIAEASDDFGAWAAGGRSSIRGFTKKEYVNGPDGIGSNWSDGGFNVLMGDGSVRYVDEGIDPKVLEALSSMSGGEVVRDF